MECSATVSSQNRVRSSSRSPCRSASPRVTASPFPQGWNYSGKGLAVTLGLAERQGDLLDDLTRFCDETVAEHSIYGFLHRERDALFPDELFSDLFQDVGRRSIPPSIVATVMVLQRVEGCSDREACDRLA